MREGQRVEEDLLVEAASLLEVGIALGHRLQHGDGKSQLGQTLLSRFAQRELDEGKSRVVILGILRDDEACTVDTGGRALRSLRHGRHAEIDVRGHVARHRPVTDGGHGRLPRLEQVAAVFARRGRRGHDAFLVQRVDVGPRIARAALGDQGLGVVGADDLAAVGPDQFTPEQLHVPGVGPQAVLVGLAVFVLVEGQLLGGSEQVIVGPVSGRVGHASRVEHVLVVEQGDGIEIARQAVVAVVELVGRQRLRIEAIQEARVGVDVGLEVQQRAAALPVEVQRRIHREHVGRRATRE